MIFKSIRTYKSKINIKNSKYFHSQICAENFRKKRKESKDNKKKVELDYFEFKVC